MIASYLSLQAGILALHDKGVKIQIANVFIHSDYNERTMDYDVAILKFATTLKLANNIQPVRLPEVGFVPQGMAKVSGWGLTSESGTISNNLRYVEVPIVTNSYCSSKLQTPISNAMICAGFDKGGKDSCQVSYGISI